MYSADDDVVVQLKGLPGINPGAPLPMVFASDSTVMLSYIVDRQTAETMSRARDSSPEIDGTNLYAAFQFDAWCHMFGYPNEEADRGHPLASRGYHAFDIFEVKQSSWIKQLERSNRVHRRHMPALFDGIRHFIFGFRDSTFEVLTEAFAFELVYDTSARSVLVDRWRSR